MNRRLTLAIAMGISLLALPLWAAEGGHEEGPGMSLVYWGINFLILVGGLAFFLRKPVKEFFASRSTLIRKNIEEATQRRANAEQKYAEYEARLKSIEKEMQELIATLKKDGELEKRRLVEQAQHQVANLSGSTDGSPPIAVGAVVNGPNGASEFDRHLGGFQDGMRHCTTKGRHLPRYDGQGSRYLDDVRVWQTNEPALDMTGAAILAGAAQLAVR